MKKTFKLSIILVLILTMAIAVFGCTRKTPDKTTKPGKQTEQMQPDKVETPEEKRDKVTDSLFDLILRDDGNYQVKLYKWSQKEVIISSEYKDKKIVVIENKAFNGSTVETLTIPNTVEEINTRFGDMKINVAEENTKYEAIDNCLIEKDGKKQLVVSNTQRFKIE